MCSFFNRTFSHPALVVFSCAERWIFLRYLSFLFLQQPQYDKGWFTLEALPLCVKRRKVHYWVKWRGSTSTDQTQYSNHRRLMWGRLTVPPQSGILLVHPGSSPQGPLDHHQIKHNHLTHRTTLRKGKKTLTHNPLQPFCLLWHLSCLVRSLNATITQIIFYYLLPLCSRCEVAGCLKINNPYPIKPSYYYRCRPAINPTIMTVMMFSHCRSMYYSEWNVNPSFITRRVWTSCTYALFSDPAVWADYTWHINAQ